MITQDPTLQPVSFSGNVWLSSPEPMGTWQVTKWGWNRQLSTLIRYLQNSTFLVTSEAMFFRAQSIFSPFYSAIFKQILTYLKSRGNASAHSYLAFGPYQLFLLFHQSNVVTKISYSWFPLDRDISIIGCQRHRQQEILHRKQPALPLIKQIKKTPFWSYRKPEAHKI